MILLKVDGTWTDKWLVSCVTLQWYTHNALRARTEYTILAQSWITPTNGDLYPNSSCLGLGGHVNGAELIFADLRPVQRATQGTVCASAYLTRLSRANHDAQLPVEKHVVVQG